MQDSDEKDTESTGSAFMERRMQFNRASAIIVLLYLILGTAHNYMRTIDAFNTPAMWIASAMMAWIFWIAMFVFVAWTIGMWQWSIREWGFTLDHRVWISLALIVATSLIFILQSGSGATSILSLKEPIMMPAIVGATLEELIFRMFLIFAIVKLLGKSAWSIAAAITISAALFTAVHIPSIPFSQLPRIFISSIVFGCIVVGTRSVLFPAFYHSISNTADALGLTGGLVVIVFYFLVAWIGPSIERRIWE